MAAIPAGQTWFDTLKRSFADVPIDAANGNAISTAEFLEAAEALVSLFDHFGSVAFGPVKSDLVGNIDKVRNRMTAAPAESATLQDLVLNELKTGKHTATEGLLWLVRGLDFTCKGLEHNLENGSAELSVSFTTAYEDSLKPYHGWVVKKIFGAAMSATPYRKNFYKKLGDDDSKVLESMKKEVDALKNVVGILQEFQKKPEAQWK
ncbi:uncharacterized protein N7459_000232 [Penicillium hispanicum]|uniref:uncharacterized protein n=1 Tax=Penicillium hispanicum TaxID=1080232 RepID=UPI002541C247|nr:uncharacterized protein N7459_000232 [Penicillium hispanicum]KAJ5594024.1 hypothetical protein N7459_000232 [Penicillium hispanicum]